jgi:serine/threonine-protein kinase
MSVSDDPRLGTELAGYRIEGLLGRGGMGVVYLAEDLRLKRRVALKLLSPELAVDEAFRERFLAESELAASIDHPNIVPIYEAGELDGLLFIAMRYVEGADLKARLREGPLPPEEAVGLLGQVASALDAAHARGLVHRDVKPSNVLLDPGAGYEGQDHAYLADFGLTKRLSEETGALEDGQVVGTIDYVAPEQITGEPVDGRADVYSLGCLLHECLTGTPPFPRQFDVAVLFAHLEDDPPPATDRRPELPEPIDQVIATALAKGPGERYPSCRALVTEARQALGIAEPARSRWLRAPVLLALAGLLLVAAGLASYLAVRGDGGEAVPAAPTGQLLRIEPGRNEVSVAAPIGTQPSGLTVGGGHVWVTDLDTNTLLRVDPSTGATVQAQTNGPPNDVAVSGSIAFVTDSNVTRFDTASVVVDGVVDTVGAAAASGDAGVWIAQSDPSVARLSVASQAEVADYVPIPLAERSEVELEEPSDIAVGEGGVWLLGDPLDNSLWHVDPDSREVVAAISLPSVPGRVTAGGGAVWVTGLLDDVVWRIDPATNQIVATIEVGQGVAGVAAGPGEVWVANSLDRTVMRIDPATNEVAATVPVAEVPTELAVGDGAVWVATRVSASEVADEATIDVGVLSPCVPGYFATEHDPTIVGAELALLERGGSLGGAELTDGVDGVSIGGRPVRLWFGCARDLSTSSLFEARRLVEGVGVDVLVGPALGHEGLAFRDYAKRHPEVTFVNGVAAAPSATLREPAPNFFRFLTDGTQWVAGLGSYAYHDLGWRTAAVLEYDYKFAWVQSAGFIAEFCSLGGEIAERISLSDFEFDAEAAAASIPAGVDGLFAAAPPDTFHALASSTELGFSGPPAEWLTGGVETTLFPPDQEAADRLVGVAVSGPTDPETSAWAAFVRDLHEAFPEEVARSAESGIFGVGYYNAMNAVLGALEAVEGDLSNGQRRFQAELSRLELDAPNGRLRLDGNRQAIGPNYLQRFEEDEQGNPAVRTFRVLENVEQTFNGYFATDSPPSGPAEPQCVVGNPPAWTTPG